MRQINDASRENLTSFICDSVEPVSKIRNDGWYGYNDLRRLDYTHEKTSPSSSDDPAVVMPGVHRIASLLK